LYRRIPLEFYDPFDMSNKTTDTISDEIVRLVQTFNITLENPMHICSKCRLLLVNAFQIECGCYLCGSCAVKYSDSIEPLVCQGGGSLCSTIKRETIRVDVAKRREMSRLPMKCPFSDNCTEDIKLPILQTHFLACQHVEISCDSCNVKILRGLLMIHQQNDCPLKMVICRYCFSSFPRDYYNNHHLDYDDDECCEKYFFECPYNCSPRPSPFFGKTSIKSHAKECPFWQVSCPFKKLGCSWKGAEVELVNHTSEMLASHAKLLLNIVCTFGFNVVLMTKVIDEIQTNGKLEETQQKFLKIAGDIEKMIVATQGPNLISSSLTSSSSTTCSSTSNTLLDQVEDLKSKSWLDDTFIWCIDKVRAKCRSGVAIQSKPFYAGKYKWQLNFDPNWRQSTPNSNNIQICVLFGLINGEYDEIVGWPFSGSVKLQLIHARNSPLNHTEHFTSQRSSEWCQRPSNTNVRYGGPLCLTDARRMETFIREDKLYVSFQVIPNGMPQPIIQSLPVPHGDIPWPIPLFNRTV
jgi:hypothetical protein